MKTFDQANDRPRWTDWHPASDRLLIGSWKWHGVTSHATCSKAEAQEDPAILDKLKDLSLQELLNCLRNDHGGQPYGQW